MSLKNQLKSILYYSNNDYSVESTREDFNCIPTKHDSFLDATLYLVTNWLGTQTHEILPGNKAKYDT